MTAPGFDLSRIIAERIAGLPVDAQRLIGLGSLQRCYATFVRSVELHPHRAAYRPAIEAGLALAWARAEGQPVDEDECRTVAAELRSFDPSNPEAPEHLGDDSWVVLTYGGLSDELDLTTFATWAEYAKAIRPTAANLMFAIYGRAEARAGRSARLAEKTSASGFLLDLATQVRHHEWLRFRTVDNEIVRRIRADSERVGLELASIVDGWRA
ncbi:hypothetical protein [Virgisporangium aurantiacum]|uniref:Uncharacterized protein n=1 Tax=Virgisporangium aurantiacum TaxID=175570 RepID=A0A8J3Z975_9ACTN|nr:hypothetical protein [Virgisporangium aurantiacum]GIJ57188.1 hypothetical protein Vau01_047040 [Virgisporangium aurantiacum]